MFSVKWNVAVPAVVPPRHRSRRGDGHGTEHLGAARVVSRDESRVAVNAMLAPFGECSRVSILHPMDVDVCELGCPRRGHGHLLVPVSRRFLFLPYRCDPYKGAPCAPRIRAMATRRFGPSRLVTRRAQRGAADGGGVRRGFGVTEGSGVAEGSSVGDAVGDGVGDGLAVALGVGEAVADGSGDSSVRPSAPALVSAVPSVPAWVPASPWRWLGRRRRLG